MRKDLGNNCLCRLYQVPDQFIMFRCVSKKMPGMIRRRWRPFAWLRVSRTPSIQVWVGYIALFGTAIQTGAVMVVYLEEAVQQARAAPVVGGMLSSLVHILIVTPVIFAWLQERKLRN